MRIVIHGSGKMAEVVTGLIASSEHLLVAIVNPKSERLSKVTSDYDLVIDFSHQQAIARLVADLMRDPKPVVIATTGLSASDLQQIEQLSNHCPVFQDYNTSQGIAVMCKLIEHAAKLLDQEFDQTLTERHHRMKVDSPSGTALKLANSLSAELHINSVRAGGIFGDHTVTFTSGSEEITIAHSAFNRELFATGALKIGERLITLDNRLYKIESIYGGA